MHKKLSLFVAFLAATIAVGAADKSFLDGFSLAPVGALKTAHLDGPSQWGTGLDLGYDVNPFVGIHVLNLSFEGPGKTAGLGEDRWGGLLVDETDVQVDAKISSLSYEKFSLHLLGGGQTDWNDNNYGVNVGLKAQLDFSKHAGIAAGYSIRTWFKGETKADSLATLSAIFSF